MRAIFDNAGFIIPGEDVKIAGVKVGQVADLDVTEDFKAAVVLEITEPGYQDFRRDASCIVRPQNLIGERFVECKPTQPRSANAEPPPRAERDRGRPGRGPVPAAGREHHAVGRHRPDRQHDARARARAAVADPQRARHRPGGPRQGPQRGHPARQPGAAGDRQGARRSSPARTTSSSSSRSTPTRCWRRWRATARRSRARSATRARSPRPRPRSARRWPTTSRRCRASSTSSSRRWCASARSPTSPRRC